MQRKTFSLTFKDLGIDTYKEPVIYMRKDCQVCVSEGFEIQARIKVVHAEKSVIATLNIVSSDLLQEGEISLSKHAQHVLCITEGERVILSHSEPLHSLSYVRSKVYGHDLTESRCEQIINDILANRYSDIHISMFLTACASVGLTKDEIIHLTKAMVSTGKQLHWPCDRVMDKHCVGGLPGNRTTLIVVPIVAAYGLMIPKTSSRAITSPAGSADAMEVFTTVDLNIDAMKKVVDREGGCIICGASSQLSPADEILIRIERVLDFDAKGQLVASVLSKKIAAGSTHVVIDMPLGKTAKLRTQAEATETAELFRSAGHALGLHVDVLFSNGDQPVGRGIGPALEARDVLSVLCNHQDAPQDLRERALTLSSRVIAFGTELTIQQAYEASKIILESGAAFKKFQAICLAQGYFKEPNIACYHHVVCAQKKGQIMDVNNRSVAALAKLAGAPRDKTAGVDMHVRLGDRVELGQPLYTLYAESKGALHYANSILEKYPEAITIGE